MRLHQITAGTLAKQRELSLATEGTTKRKQINRPKGKMAQVNEIFIIMYLVFIINSFYDN